MESSPPRLRRGIGWLPLPVAALLACWWYRPWQGRAFDVLDFSEFLPLLTAAADAPARLASLLHYYAGVHGRFNLLGYVALAAKWSWLGAHPLRWQLVRAAELVLIAGLVYLLLRRLAATRFAAALAAVLLLFSYAAALPWVRLTMGEPLGLLAMLLAALLATRLDHVHRRLVIAAGSALLVAAAILAKEMLLLWVPALLVIGLARVRGGRLDGWRRDAKARAFLLGTGVGALAAVLPVVLAARGSGVTGYAAAYGHAPFSIARYGELLQRQLLPWPITGRSDGVVMLGAALLFLGVVLAGLLAGFRDPAWRRHCTRMLGLGLSLPVLGALAYLPWPVYAPFYGYPFVVGAALLLATALSVLQAHPGLGGRVAGAAALLALLLPVPHAVHLARAAAAQQEVMTGLASTLSHAPEARRIVVAVPVLPAQGWQGSAPSLTRYAVAITPDLVLPPAEDLTCADAGSLLRSGLERTVLITLSTGCGTLPDAPLVVRSDYRYWQWQPPGFHPDSVRADVFLPAAPH